MRLRPVAAAASAVALSAIMGLVACGDAGRDAARTAPPAPLPTLSPYVASNHVPDDWGVFASPSITDPGMTAAAQVQEVIAALAARLYVSVLAEPVYIHRPCSADGRRYATEATAQLPLPADKHHRTLRVLYDGWVAGGYRVVGSPRSPATPWTGPVEPVHPLIAQIPDTGVHIRLESLPEHAKEGHLTVSVATSCRFDKLGRWLAGRP
jgi:hypothetical protein